jgi:hypothetical protein
MNTDEMQTTPIVHEEPMQEQPELRPGQVKYRTDEAYRMTKVLKAREQYLKHREVILARKKEKLIQKNAAAGIGPRRPGRPRKYD